MQIWGRLICATLMKIIFYSVNDWNCPGPVWLYFNDQCRVVHSALMLLASRSFQLLPWTKDIDIILSSQACKLINFWLNGGFDNRSVLAFHASRKSTVQLLSWTVNFDIFFNFSGVQVDQFLVEYGIFGDRPVLAFSCFSQVNRIAFIIFRIVFDTLHLK